MTIFYHPNEDTIPLPSHFNCTCRNVIHHCYSILVICRFFPPASKISFFFFLDVLWVHCSISRWGFLCSALDSFWLPGPENWFLLSNFGKFSAISSLRLSFPLLSPTETPITLNLSLNPPCLSSNSHISHLFVFLNYILEKFFRSIFQLMSLFSSYVYSSD